MKQKSSPTILILYTTLYRTGGPRFEHAAITLAAEKQAEFPKHQVIRKAVESKQDFLAEIAAISRDGGQIAEFHFIGHSGVYGIMFGTTEWPEQFSPYEWKQMSIPFTQDGSAKFFFHACRTGRWFAPFVARTLGVKTYGHFWYTTVSKSDLRFEWHGPRIKPTDPLYVVSCAGKKSHGVLASMYKYSAKPKVYPMTEFSPTDERIDSSYDSVAQLYDDTFQDIGVRKDEWDWLTTSMGDLKGKRILDIGCGNGALLRKLSDRFEGDLEGRGVDASEGMIEQARKGCAGYPGLSFAKVDGPQLPYPDNSFDCVTSVLSFRYLDWDPILKEILRVLKPGGEILVVDMVAAPVKWKELPRFIKSKSTGYLQRVKEPNFYRTLHRMVTDPRWKQMLKYNPIRAEHEMKWYLESRFAGKRANVINIGWNSRILAFRSGPVTNKAIEPMQFP
jgi:ubiquinone/menaquinone biosynthesis C-methylase UbiE